jgi:FlaA1/EpsC-like NDP-sugar epimerase
MEANVKEAITNNVLGTLNVLRAAERYGVERFVFISTDKAVNPTSIMGATKRLAEWLVVGAARRSGRAYLAVRFGNVLGSRGSVIPIFQRQIAAGGPLTITHPDMRRYFMTIPEAVQLVLQASELGQGGEIFVLDMGQPVRILDLATDLIKLSGLKPGRDIQIVYTGIRPGEKLNEELFLECEDCQRTKHRRILVATHENIIEAEMLEQLVVELVNLTRQLQSQNATEQMRVLLLKICYYIDGYKPMRFQAALALDRQPEFTKPLMLSYQYSATFWP